MQSTSLPPLSLLSLARTRMCLFGDDSAGKANKYDRTVLITLSKKKEPSRGKCNVTMNTDIFKHFNLFSLSAIDEGEEIFLWMTLIKAIYSSMRVRV